MADLERPAEIWGVHISDIAGGGSAGEETEKDKDHLPACGERVRDPKIEPHRGRYQ